MRRPLFALLMVLGVGIGALGIIGLADHHPRPSPTFTATAPARFAVTLTPGSWSIYGRAGTGPYGTPLPVDASVTAPDGAAVPLSPPDAIATLHAGGVTFSQSATIPVASAGTYEVTATTGGNVPLAVAVTPSPRTEFHWGPLILDGGILFAVGAALLTLDTRNRRQVDVLEAAYAAETR